MKKLIVFCLFVCLAIAVNANVTRITGRVLDLRTQEAIIGAYVNVLGSSSSTVTDINGDFSVIAQLSGNIAFSAIGYISKIQKATQNMIVYMEDDTTSLGINNLYSPIKTTDYSKSMFS